MTAARFVKRRAPRRASKRERLARIRRLAPKHPSAPEARIRLEFARILGAFHDKVRARVRQLAQLPKRSASGPLRVEARTASEHAHAGALDDLKAQGRHMLAQSGLRKNVRAQAQKTADSTRKQVAKAINRPTAPADLSTHETKLTDDTYDIAAFRIDDSVDRAGEILTQFDLDADELDDLDDEVTQSLDGALGLGLAAVGILFGAVWGAMNRQTQTDNGVGSYVWLSQKDSVVRPEHLALDGQEADWDTPLLTAEDSSNGDECYPGDDYNCRCVAAPVPPDEEE